MSTEDTPTDPGGTWAEATMAFEAAATWLGDADKPQVKALYAIAAQLDAGTFQAALISQYTLVHRGLLARQPNGKGSGSGKGSADPWDTPMDFGTWRADA